MLHNALILVLKNYMITFLIKNSEFNIDTTLDCDVSSL